MQIHPAKKVFLPCLQVPFLSALNDIAYTVNNQRFKQDQLKPVRNERQRLDI